jgi:DNA replication protein DnaC
MFRLSAIKTLSGFDFTFQPSLDRGRIMTLAELKFIDRSEAVHFVGPPGTGKSHLSRLSCPFSRALDAKFHPAFSVPAQWMRCRHARWRAGTERRLIML